MSSSNASNVCVITNVDSLTGYALAYHILEQIRDRKDSHSESHRLRVLTRSRENELGLDVLEKMGAEVMEVDYNDEKKVKEAVRQAKNVVLVPEQSRNRWREAENVIKAAKQADVNHFVVISVTGVDRIEQNNKSESYRNMQEYLRIEQKVKETFSGEKHCIIRHPVFNQHFYFMGPQMENENKLALPIEKRDKWTTVDLNDMNEAIWRLTRKQQQEGSLPSLSRKNTYEFCSGNARTTEEQVQEISQGLDRKDLRFQKISGREMRDYLKEMRDDENFRERPKHRQNEGGSTDGRRERDTFATLPLGRFLNDQLIETMEEFWRSACEGYQEIKSNDLKDILDREPQNLKNFFKNNRENFRRLK